MVCLPRRRQSDIPLNQCFYVFVADKDIKLKLRNELNELKPGYTEGEMGDRAYHMLEDICGKTASTGAEQPTSAG